MRHATRRSSHFYSLHLLISCFVIYPKGKEWSKLMQYILSKRSKLLKCFTICWNPWLEFSRLQDCHDLERMLLSWTKMRRRWTNRLKRIVLYVTGMYYRRSILHYNEKSRSVGRPTPLRTLKLSRPTGWSPVMRASILKRQLTLHKMMNNA